MVLSWQDMVLAPLFLVLYVLQGLAPLALLWLGIKLYRAVRRIEAQLAALRAGSTPPLGPTA